MDGSAGAAGESGNESGAGKRPFQSFRSLSVKNLAPTVFVQKPDALVAAPPAPAGPVPRVRYGIRRTNSLPDRLDQQRHIRPPGAMLPAQIPLMSLSTASTAANAHKDDEDEHLTRWAAVILLLVSTGLVAVCAEFLVGSIKEVTESSSLGEIFIGLIILPIVGNAAEHVTAVTVAMKNKMDLAIGVAVGSSIQIALFVTPLVVILGWIMDKEMTLYFTLFETVCLFVSAFIVNFLVLDGRSNYLEGALLCAVYVIIAVVAFFYPEGDDASSWGN
jgi:Ca2+/H+ antiporter